MMKEKYINQVQWDFCQIWKNTLWQGLLHITHYNCSTLFVIRFPKYKKLQKFILRRLYTFLLLKPSKAYLWYISHKTDVTINFAKRSKIHILKRVKYGFFLKPRNICFWIFIYAKLLYLLSSCRYYFKSLFCTWVFYFTVIVYIFVLTRHFLLLCNNEV